MLSYFSSFFSSSAAAQPVAQPQPEAPVAAVTPEVAENFEVVVSPAEKFAADLLPANYRNFSLIARQICNVVEENIQFKKHDPFPATMAGKLFNTYGARFVYQSNHPGCVEFQGKPMHFDKADYFLEVSREGSVDYKIRANGVTTSIPFHAIDPDLKYFHDQHIEPLLRQADVELEGKNQARMVR